MVRDIEIMVVHPYRVVESARNNLTESLLARMAEGGMAEILLARQAGLEGFEKQVAIIYAATKGYLDTVPVEEVRRYEEELYRFLEARHAAVLTGIATKQVLDDEVKGALETFQAAVLKRPEVMECYLMTGTSDYLLPVAVADLETFRTFVVDFLSGIPGVGNIQSSVALKRVKYQTALPLPVEKQKPAHRKRR